MDEDWGNFCCGQGSGQCAILVIHTNPSSQPWSLFKANPSRVEEFYLKVIFTGVFPDYKILIHDRKSSN